MPIIDGEKWACASCIKGHRVSGCNHGDRELHHINPKGRPVKQCEHCRGARKSKSHHAKCDCGDKKDRNKEKKDAKVDDGSCCCRSGAKCICGMKKDGLDLKIDTKTLHGTRQKPKLTTTHSESTLTVFANGHHKPCHRNNNTAHNSGAPYKIPRPRSLHGHAAFASYSQDKLDCVSRQADAPAQRAMDTLSLSNNDFYAMFGSAPRSVDGLPFTPLSGGLDNGFQDSLFTIPSATSYGQDGNSPAESQAGDTVSPQQWPWANPMSSMSRNYGFGSLSTSPSQDCLTNLDSDWAIPSAGLNNPLWSATDLPLDPNKLNDTLAQPVSHHSSESNQHSAPGLTTSSSSHSEIGEPLFGDVPPHSATSDNVFWEDSTAFRMATSAANDARPAPMAIGARDVDARRSSPFESELAFTSNALAFSPAGPEASQAGKRMGSSSSSIASTSAPNGLPMFPSSFGETSAMSMPNNVDDVVANDPWIDQNSAAAFGMLGSYDNSPYPNWL